MDKMNFTKDNSKGFHSASLEKPPYAPGKVVTMDRAAGRSIGGSGFKLTATAKDGDPSPTVMGRNTKKSPGGGGKSSLPPCTATYGTKGVSSGGGRGYGTGE